MDVPLCCGTLSNLMVAFSHKHFFVFGTLNSYFTHYLFSIFSVISAQTRFFVLVSIFLKVNWILRFTLEILAFSPNTSKKRPKNLRNWTLFTQ